MYTISIEERTQHILACHGRHPRYSPRVARGGISGRCCDILEEPGGTYKHFRHILKVFPHTDGTIKLKKCKFFSNTINCLGHVIHLGQLMVSQHTIEGIRDLNPPTNITKLRTFLSLCNVSRYFVPNFARIAALLTRMVNKSTGRRLLKTSLSDNGQ